MDHPRHILKLIADSRQTLMRGMCASLVLVVAGEFPVSSYRPTQCIVLQLINALFCLLIVGWLIAAQTHTVGHLAWRLGLKSDRHNDFAQAMGLLSEANTVQPQLTRTLQDRALEPWIKPITRVCHVRHRVLLILFLQFICIIGIWSIVFNRPRLIPLPMPVAEQTANLIDSTDTQQNTSVMDQLAHALLQMRDQLDAITDQMSSEQMQQIMSQLNASWQGINAHMTTIPQEGQLTQLQIATWMPLGKSQTIQSENFRKTLRDALTKDITPLAMRGARFDGTGMISHGQSNVPDSSSANMAEGRYDEQIQTDGMSIHKPIQRRLVDVPPMYRKAVAAFLNGTPAMEAKGHKGVQP